MPTSGVTVNAKPVASIVGPSTICVGATTLLNPTTGGTWQSSDPTLATISNAGVVNAISAGVVYFTFTISSSNCSSDPSSPVTINPKPGISFTGSTTLCIGSNTSLSPTTGGIWTSSNPLVASIGNNGFIKRFHQVLLLFNILKRQRVVHQNYRLHSLSMASQW